MLTIIQEHLEEIVAVLLFAIGFTTLLLQRNLIKKIIGFNIMDTAIYLLLTSVGYIEGRTAPILTDGIISAQYYINPIPAGLVLTGIVVSVSVSALMLALTVRLYRRYRTLDIDESRHELKHEDKEGNSVSYTPPRYEYSYDFYITIFVNNPYFNEMRFQVNSSSIDITPPPSVRPGMPARCNPETNVEYRNCKKLGEEIRQALTQVRKDVREKIEQAAAPKMAVTCPYCGATTTPDASGCCEYCGGAVNG